MRKIFILISLILLFSGCVKRAKQAELQPYNPNPVTNDKQDKKEINNVQNFINDKQTENWR